MGKPCGRGRTVSGQTDVPLSEQGRQALSPASFSPEKVYITALQRTRQTAERLFPQARLVVVEDLGGNELWTVRGTKCGGDGGGPVLPCLGGGHVPGTMSRRERVCLRFPAVSAGPSPDCWIGRWPLRKSSLFLWSTGGTQMAVMEAFAIPSRPYFSWGLPCGQGYVLEAEGWLEHRQLRLLGKRDYTKRG